jgi:hypothetical protein
MKKSFDAVAWMRARRERLDQDYAGLSCQEIGQKIQESIKDDPLWKRLQRHVLKKDQMTVHEPRKPYKPQM